MKKAQKIADCTGQDCKRGESRAEVITQAVVGTPLLTRPADVTTTAGDSNCGAATAAPPDALDASNCQSAKKVVDCQIQHQSKNRQKSLLLARQRRAQSARAKIKARCERRTIEGTLSGIELLRIIKLMCFDAEEKSG